MGQIGRIAPISAAPRPTVAAPIFPRVRGKYPAQQGVGGPSFPLEKSEKYPIKGSSSAIRGHWKGRACIEIIKYTHAVIPGGAQRRPRTQGPHARSLPPLGRGSPTPEPVLGPALLPDPGNGFVRDDEPWSAGVNKAPKPRYEHH